MWTSESMPNPFETPRDPVKREGAMVSLGGSNKLDIVSDSFVGEVVAAGDEIVLQRNLPETSYCKAAQL